MIPRMPELAFVLPSGGADRVADLAAALAAEVGAQDAVAVVAASPPQPRPDRVHVLLQGAGEGETALPARDLPRTIVVLLAPPRSERFAAGVELARQAGTVFHVNSAAIESLHALGVPARHLQLGYAPRWEGSSVPTSPPAAEILRDRGGYCDWLGVLLAIHRGAVVVHEEALGVAPLLVGRHLLVGPPPELDALAATLERDPDRLARIQAETRDFLREALPMALAAAVLIGSARMLVAQPLPVGAGSIPGQPSPRSK
jgi:hypothetical protein